MSVATPARAASRIVSADVCTCLRAAEYRRGIGRVVLRHEPRKFMEASVEVPAQAPAPPDVTLDATMLLEVELSLLSAAAHAAEGPEATAALEPPHVRIVLPAAIATEVFAAGGAVLRDEESTPLAQLTTSAGASLSDATERVVVDGAVTRLRSRESGNLSRHGLAEADLRPRDGGARALLILARPLVDADISLLHSLTASAAQLLVVTPERASHGITVPPTILFTAAKDIFGDISLSVPVQLRTAPLALSQFEPGDPTLDKLTAMLHAEEVLVLTELDDTPGGHQWQAARAALEQGTQTDYRGISRIVAERLQRWRPPRSRRGLVVLFTGLSGSGKSTLARDLRHWIEEETERTVTLLDGDVVRQMLSAGLGFDRASRELNVTRIGFVAAQIAHHGGIAICAPIAPYAATRAVVRSMAEAAGDFVLVHVSTPLAECERRDLKGFYAKARAGEIPEFTGISDPYEAPDDADLIIDTARCSPSEALNDVLAHLRAGGWIIDDEPVR